MKRWIKILIIFIMVLITIGIISVLGSYSNTEQFTEVNLNEFRDLILKKSFSEISISGATAEGIVNANIVGNNTPNMFANLPINNTDDWINLMIQKDIPVKIKSYGEKISILSSVMNIIGSILGTIVYFLFLMYMFSGNGITSKKHEFVRSNVTFLDVAGMKVIKQEVQEVIDFLKYPKKYEALNCKTPKGIMLSGSPGNGKTLIAKAIAGESGVNFIATSAASFIEIFVGTGPKAIKELFQAARKNTPCVVFIDEMDSLGSRSNYAHGGGSEQNKTINQFLAEMDGLTNNSGILVIGATNDPSSIDPAALRSGRFDRHLSVSNPDYQERLLVLDLYCKSIPLDHSVCLDLLAKNTAGFSRADLANMINEAKIYAVRQHKKYVTSEHFKNAFDRICFGLPGDKIVDEALKNTAYHEAGHAFMYYYYAYDSVDKSKKILGLIYKATIIPYSTPQGQSLGFVMPENNDRKSVSKIYTEANIQVCFAGRIAEEMYFGLNNVTTGCSSDLQQAREMAERYVVMGSSTKYKLKFITKNKEIMSEGQKEELNNVINELMNDMEDKARQIMSDNKKSIERLALRLLEEETLTGQQIVDILEETIFLPVKYQVQSSIRLK